MSGSVANADYRRTALLTSGIGLIILLIAFAFVMRDELHRLRHAYIFMVGRSLLLLAVSISAAVVLRLVTPTRKTFRTVVAGSVLVSAGLSVIAWWGMFGKGYRPWLTEWLDTPARALDVRFWPAYREPYIGHWFGVDQWFAWIFQSLFPVYLSIFLVTGSALACLTRLLTARR